MMHTPIWRSEDAHLLRNLRESANLDDLVFARMNAISLTQLHELEGQGEGLFYNEQIKANTGNKLLKKLGHAIVQPASAHEQAAELATEMPTKCASAQPLLSAPHLLATPAPMGASSFSLRLFKGKGLNIEPKWAGALLVLCLVTWTVSQARWSELRPAPDAGARTTGAQPLLNLTLVAQQTGPAHNRLDTVSAATMASLTLPLSASPEALKTGTPNPSGAAAGQNSKADCDVQQIQSSAIHESHDPIKAGNYIHFVAHQDVALCVRDHQNKLTRLQLGAGSARSVYGAPPFLVHSANWPSLQVFFQGRRVTGAPERSAHWVFKSKEVPHP